MKKSIAILLALLTLFALAACGRTVHDPKQVKLNAIRKNKDKTVSAVFMFPYDSGEELNAAVELPQKGTLYLVVYADSDYDLAVCKKNGAVQAKYNHQELFEEAKAADWKGEAYDKAVFLENALEKASAVIAGGDVTVNYWYRFTPEETAQLQGIKAASGTDDTDSER